MQLWRLNPMVLTIVSQHSLSPCEVSDLVEEVFVRRETLELHHRIDFKNTLRVTKRLVECFH